MQKHWKNVILGIDQIWLLAFLFPPSCWAVAISAAAALAAGFLVPGAGRCHCLIPSAPDVLVTPLPEWCHGCGGTAPAVTWCSHSP